MESKTNLRYHLSVLKDKSKWIILTSGFHDLGSYQVVFEEPCLKYPLCLWRFGLVLSFSSIELLRSQLMRYQLNQKFLQTLLTGSSLGCLTSKICLIVLISIISLWPEATHQGKTWIQYICTTDQRSEREDIMTVVPVMLLVVFFILWELQMLPVSQVQLCVGFHVGWRKIPCLSSTMEFYSMFDDRIEPLRIEHAPSLPHHFS